jgi:glycosyltransferase involved in cell wall biosynthesis
MRKLNNRTVNKVGLASSDWSQSVFDYRGLPVQGGAGWIRFGQMAQAMRNHLILGRAQPILGRLAVETPDSVLHQDISVVILQRYMEKNISNFITKSRDFGIPVINDVDDWFWGLHEDNAAFDITDPNNNPESNTDYYRESLEASNFVTVSTPFLADQISQWNPNVQIIENCVSSEMFKRRRHYLRKPVIGWCGSTGHRSDDLRILIEPFKQMGTFVSYHHTGDIPTQPKFAEKVKVSPTRIKVIPMLAPSEYPSGFTFDIGVVPLNDIPFNHAKSWIKGLEYAAAGIPFVSSPLPEYIRLKEQYGIGRLASTTEEWVQHFSELLDPKVREEEAIYNRNVVRSEFPASKMARAWDEIIWKVVNNEA